MEQEQANVTPEPVTPAPKTGGSATLWWLLGILVVLLLIVGGWYVWSKPKTTTPATTPATTPTSSTNGTDATSGKKFTPMGEVKEWKTYKTSAGKEELAEPGQAVVFTIDYPATWNYKIFDEEVKAQGAGTTLHMVGFDGVPADQIYMIGKRLTITAEAKNLDKEVSVVTSSYKSPTDVKKTEGTAGGQKMVKIVDVSKSTSGTNLPVWVFVQSPGSWILTLEGGSIDEAVIDQMLKTLKFTQ